MAGVCTRSVCGVRAWTVLCGCVVFGAGEGGNAGASRAMLRNPTARTCRSRWSTTIPASASLRLIGVRVRGTGADDSSTSPAGYGADAVLIAIPSAPSERARARCDARQGRGPAGARAAAGRRAVRHVGLVATSARSPTPTCSAATRSTSTSTAIAGYLTGRRVLVTGAGGSIGSELCRQIARVRPGALVMLDRDESALHAVQLVARGPGPARLRRTSSSPTSATATASSRSSSEHRPEVVFHAAALKHLPLLEMSPAEAWKTNVVGHPARARGGARPPASTGSSTSPPTRPPTRPACSATRSGSPSGSPPHAAEPHRAAVRLGPLRQRARLAGLDARRVRGADRTTAGRSPSPHPDVTRYFMTVGGGGRAGHPGRRHRSAGRGARARHG